MARRDRRRATTGAFAVSALVHLALFIVLAYQAAPSLRAPAPAEPDFQVQLVTLPPTAEPAQTQRPRSPRRAPAVASRPILRSRVAPQPRPAARAIQPARPVPAHAPPAPIAPPAPAAANAPAAGTRAGQAGAGAAQGGGSGRWSVQGGEGDEDGARKFLRATVGCSHEDFAQLRPDERANCYRRIGQDARSLGIPPDKLAGFIAAAEARERAHADHTGPMPEVFTPCKGPGSNLDRGCVNVKSDRPEDGP